MVNDVSLIKNFKQSSIPCQADKKAGVSEKEVLGVIARQANLT